MRLHTPPPRRSKFTAKERLLAAGERLFTASQEPLLTSRMIAEEAQVNHALIAYHYGTLSNLMGDVVSRCIAKLQDRLLPEVQAFAEALENTEDAALHALFTKHMLGILEALQGKESSGLLSAIASPKSRHVEGVYERFTDSVTAPLFKCFHMFIVRFRKKSITAEESAILTQILMAHVMSFFRGGALVSKYLGQASLTEAQKSLTNKIIVETAFALCKGIQ